MRTFLSFILLATCTSVCAQSRFDSLDVSKYAIHLDIDIPSKTIKGYTEVTIQSKKAGLTQLSLDLFKLQVDSVVINGLKRAYNHNDTILKFTAPAPINTGDSILAKIYYHGSPVSDATWGGFYFSGPYAYNLGVGFTANPNSFGRVWYPCIDDFRSRSTYDYFITADAVNKVFCNGLLQSTTPASSGKQTWHWKEARPTPVYLSSVAIAPYASITWTYRSRLTQRNIPVILNALPADTAKLRASFKNLDSATAVFEELFGPYPFDRIGYNIVPFSGGAMEHTGNIAYPLFAIDGTLAQEGTMAHELAHSWFGGLYNCATSADMWLNEGWADYCESLFRERVYGKKAYTDRVRENHHFVIRYAHLLEGSYLPVSGVPHNRTYGTHSYRKGSDVAHSLRGLCYGYPSLSLESLQLMFKNNPLMPVYSYWESSDQYFNCGVNQRLTWMKSPGFPHLQLKNWSWIKQGNQYKLNLAVDRGATGSKSPDAFVTDSSLLYITAFSSTWQRTDLAIVLPASNPYPMVETLLPFAPAYVAIDLDERMSDAVTDKYAVMKQNDSADFGEALMRIKVNTSIDSALVRVEHHWYPADQRYCKIPGLFVSNYRYWLVDGLWPNGFGATGYITYDGRQISPIGNGLGYLDHTFIRKTEDSLTLVYREKATDNWTVYTDAVKTMGGKTDKFGSIRINNLKKGEYALAMYDVSLGADLKAQSEPELNVYPNPARQELTIDAGSNLSGGLVVIADLSGKRVLEQTLKAGQKELTVSVQTLARGMYFVYVQRPEGTVCTRVSLQ